LKEIGCAWNDKVSIHAATKGHLEILKWLKENGCPIDQRECVEVTNQVDVLDWLLNMK